MAAASIHGICAGKFDAGDFKANGCGKKCPGFGNFVPKNFIDGKRRWFKMFARFVEHFIVLKD